MTKIFGIGAHKTGTSSLTKALRVLGIPTSQRADHEVSYEDICAGNFRLRALKTNDAILDNPIPAFYKEFDKAFPNSKFILTIREPESWFKSVEKHLNGRQINQEEEFFYGKQKVERETFIKTVEAHNRAVKEYFKNRPNDLLVLDIAAGEGWEKLCPFLNKPLPRGSFPHQGRGEFKWLLRKIKFLKKLIKKPSGEA